MGIVIRNAMVVLPDGDEDRVGRHTLYTEGDRIAGIDSIHEGFKEDVVIDGEDSLVIPGLINAHTHSYMTLMRNYADDISFTDWLFNTVGPVENRMSPEDAYISSMLGQLEMIRSGTTTFNDMQMHIHQTTRAVRETGMRAVISRGLTGDRADRSDRRLCEALEEMGDGKDLSRLTFRLGPHAPYTCSKEYLRMVSEVAREEGLGIHIHLSESVTEIENMRKEHNCTPIEYAMDAGLFEVPCLAAHCVQVNVSDIHILKQHNVSVVTNPASNMKLGNGFAPVPRMLEEGVNVCLGTDGAASNNAQNMIREMGLLGLIHKGVNRTSQCVGAAKVFRMATLDAARALGLDKETGSIEKGKKADLAILDLNALSLNPNTNLIGALTYSANGSEVKTVIIDGQIVMENREIKTVDEEMVRRRAAETATRLL